MSAGAKTANYKTVFDDKDLCSLRKIPEEIHFIYLSKKKLSVFLNRLHNLFIFLKILFTSHIQIYLLK